MKREEFNRLFLTDEIKKDILDYKEGDEVVIYVRLKTIYNNAINAFRPSLKNAPVDYYYKYTSLVMESAHRNLQNATDEKTLLELLKKDKLVAFLIDRKYPFVVEIKVIPSSIDIYGEPHHYTVYALIKVKIEYVYAYYGNGYKRKVFLFFDDGVLEIKYPPYNLNDTCKDIGVFPRGNILEIVSS